MSIFRGLIDLHIILYTHASILLSYIHFKAMATTLSVYDLSYRNLIAASRILIHLLAKTGVDLRLQHQQRENRDLPEPLYGI